VISERRDRTEGKAGKTGCEKGRCYEDYETFGGRESEIERGTMGEG